MPESTTQQFQLCFRSLFDSGRGYAFPCDPRGQVDMDRMSERAVRFLMRAQAAHAASDDGRRAPYDAGGGQAVAAGNHAHHAGRGRPVSNREPAVGAF